MAISLADVSGAQYGAVTGRRRLPFSSYAYLLSQVPGFNQQAGNRINARLANESLDQQARQFDLNYDLALAQQELQNEQLGIAGKQANIGNMINLAGIGTQTLANWDKIKTGAGKGWDYAIGLKDAAMRSMGYDVPAKVTATDLLAGKSTPFAAKTVFEASQPTASELLAGTATETFRPAAGFSAAPLAEIPEQQLVQTGSFLEGTGETMLAPTTKYFSGPAFNATTPSLSSAGASYLLPTAETSGAGLVAEPGLGLSGAAATAINPAPGSIAAQEIAASQAGSQAAQGVGLGTSLAAAGAGFLTNLGVGAAMRGLDIGGENERRDIPAAAGGAVSGALIGAGTAIGGPVGALIGAGLGLASGWIFCFAAGTPIRMADGSDKPVEDLELNDCVHLGGLVQGVGRVFAGDIYDLDGVSVQGDHAVFTAGRWRRVKDMPTAKIANLPAPIVVYPVITENHLLVSGQTIFADLCETDQGMCAADHERLAALNADLERNAMLWEEERALRI